MLNVVEDSQARITRLELGIYRTNSYILECKSTGESLLIDTPSETDVILGQLKRTSPCLIALTHSHIDHTEGLSELKAKLAIPLAVHPLDAVGLPTAVEMDLEGGRVINVGNLKVTALHTPGHTQGSMCFLLGKYLLAGDTIFPGGPGHTSTPSEFKQIVESIRAKILTLADDTLILPGHGESTLLSAEREAIAGFDSRSHAEDLHGDVLWLSS
jgi:hydroxyacylglutathione hydrolase